MTAFTRANVFHALRARVEATAPFQIADPAHPDAGGIAPPATGIAEPGHVGTAAFIAASAFSSRRVPFAPSAATMTPCCSNGPPAPPTICCGRSGRAA